MTTTRHSWINNRTDNDRKNNTITEFDTCRVCELIRITVKCSVNKTFLVTYVEKNGTEHQNKLPFPCKPHCKECKQKVEFTEL